MRTPRIVPRSGERRLLSDQRGVALLEFAFVLPFLVMLFVGGFQLMDAISAYRKVGTTVRTLADLTTRNVTLTTAQADEILSASQQVMAPYSPSSAVMRISAIQVDLLNRPIVKWSQARNGIRYATGAVVTLPSGLAVAGRYLILAEITYTYTPRIAPTFIGTIPLNQTLYMSPRNSPSIAYN